MKKIKLGILGADGRMGQALTTLISQSNEVFEAFLAVSKVSQDKYIFSVTDLEGVEQDVLDSVDVWIDFTSAAYLEKFLSLKSIQNKPLVSGSTGLSSKQFELLKKSSAQRPILWASNMSIGIWLVRQMLKCFQYVSGSNSIFDYAVTEIHHKHKKDNPSGTAKTLHEDLVSYVQDSKVSLEKGLRVGEIFGQHQIHAASSSEVIKIEHTALNRRVFAEGALSAAQWLVTKKSGLYSMDDLMMDKSKLKIKDKI